MGRMSEYEKIRVVGRGAYGVVQLCRRRSDGLLVIVKTVPVEEMTREERQAAMNEVKVLKLLDHPNIIAYHDSFVEEKALMIVMEYAEGGTIFQYLQNRDSLLPEPELMHLFVQMVLSLKAVHGHSVLHRDLKTQNIMLDRRHAVVKIGDFGISKVLSSKSRANTVVGTPCYISPELCEGRPYNQQSDIWALGCVLYEMATLRRAFDAPNLPALVLKIMRGTVAPIDRGYSQAFRCLLLSMLHLDPDQRPRLSEILAQPICQAAWLGLQTSLGRLPGVRASGGLSMSLPRSGGGIGGGGSSGSNSRYSNGSGTGGGGDGNGLSSSEAEQQHRGRVSSHVFMLTIAAGTFGLPAVAPAAAAAAAAAATATTTTRGGVTTTLGEPPRQLPMLPDTQVIAVGVTRTAHYGVCEDGRLVEWRHSRVPIVPPPPPPPSSLPSSSLSTSAATTDTTEVLSPWIPRVVAGLSGLKIKILACGDAFIACLTDRGILMTMGSGAQGCLGHGEYENSEQARIVEALLGYEICTVAAGDAHVAAVGAEGEVFTWGLGGSGRLGLGGDEGFCVPRPVPLKAAAAAAISEEEGGGSRRKDIKGSGSSSSNNNNDENSGGAAAAAVAAAGATNQPAHIVRAFCGPDCTILLTREGRLLGAGSNRYNKIALAGDESDRDGGGGGGGDIKPQRRRRDSLLVAAEEAHTFMPVQASALMSEVVVSVALGAHHMAVVTQSRRVYTYGSDIYGQLGHGEETTTMATMSATPATSSSSSSSSSSSITKIKEQNSGSSSSSGGTTTMPPARPGLVAALVDKSVVAASCGDAYTVAVTETDDIFVWGRGTAIAPREAEAVTTVATAMANASKGNPIPTLLVLDRAGAEVSSLGRGRGRGHGHSHAAAATLLPLASSSIAAGEGGGEEKTTSVSSSSASSFSPTPTAAAAGANVARGRCRVRHICGRHGITLFAVFTKASSSLSRRRSPKPHRASSSSNVHLVV